MKMSDTNNYFIRGSCYRIYMNKIHNLFINTNINYLPIILQTYENLPPTYEETLKNINNQTELPIYSMYNIDNVCYTWMNDS